MVSDIDLISGHLNPWSCALQWCGELFHEFASDTMAKHSGTFNCQRFFLHVECWNVSSLVEMDGGTKTATV